MLHADNLAISILLKNDIDYCKFNVDQMNEPPPLSLNAKGDTCMFPFSQEKGTQTERKLHVCSHFLRKALERGCFV